MSLLESNETSPTRLPRVQRSRTWLERRQAKSCPETL